MWFTHESDCADLGLYCQITHLACLSLLKTSSTVVLGPLLSRNPPIVLPSSSRTSSAPLLLVVYHVDSEQMCSSTSTAFASATFSLSVRASFHSSSIFGSHTCIPCARAFTLTDMLHRASAPPSRRADLRCYQTSGPLQHPPLLRRGPAQLH